MIDPKLLRKVLFFGILFDLSGDIGIRNIIFIITIPLLIYHSVSKQTINLKKLSLFFFLLILYPCFLLIKSNFNNDVLVLKQFIGVSQLFVFVIFLEKVPPKRLLDEFLSVIIIIEIIALILFFGAFFHINILESIFEYIGAKYNEGYFGHLRLANIDYPQVYFKSTLIFVFPAIYFFIEKQYYKSLLSITVLFLALSKSGFFLSLIGILIFLIIKRKFKMFFLFFISTLLFVYTFEWYIEIIQNILESKTAATRFNQYYWFLDYIKNISDFLFGQGFGYSIELNNVFVSAIELDHIDTIRKYGLFWTILYSLPLALLMKTKNLQISHKIAYFMTYIAVGTNPIFITNIFFILSFFIYNSYYHDSNNYSYLEKGV